MTLLEWVEHSASIAHVALVVGALIWVAVGALVWRSSGWPGRLVYAVGGAVLALYEIHMLWIWLALGLTLTLAAVWLSDRSSDAKVGRSLHAFENGSKKTQEGD